MGDCSGVGVESGVGMGVAGASVGAAVGRSVGGGVDVGDSPPHDTATAARNAASVKTKLILIG